VTREPPSVDHSCRGAVHTSVIWGSRFWGSGSGHEPNSPPEPSEWDCRVDTWVVVWMRFCTYVFAPLALTHSCSLARSLPLSLSPFLPLSAPGRCTRRRDLARRTEPECEWPMSSEYGTYKTVKARFCPWLSGYRLENLQGVPSLLGRERTKREAA